MRQQRQLATVLMGLALVAALVTWLWSRQERVESPGAGPPISGPRTQPSVVPVGESVESQVSTGAAAQAAPVSCPDQSVEVAIQKQPPGKSCVGQTRTIANGSVRTYRVEAQDRNAPSLTIDTAAGSILRAEIDYPDGGKFSCLRDKCGGISMGPHDAQGARSIRFKDAKLTRDAETAVVNATFRTTPDDQVASTTCVGQLLYISVGEGTVHFCPDSGSGFQRGRDGSTAYKFRNGDGNTVSVRLGREGALQSVEYRSFTCRPPNCAGVSVSPAGADERRNFMFQGTVLTEQGAGVTTAILNGNLVLAPQ